MKELKFRAWHEGVEEMCTGLNEDMEFDFGGSCSTYGLADAINASCIKVMQFTGLKDVDGKDLYEGDIVQCEENYVYKILWSEKDFMFEASDCGGLCDLPLPVKIIGNIYDNPELMEESK